MTNDARKKNGQLTLQCAGDGAIGTIELPGQILLFQHRIVPGKLHCEQPELHVGRFGLLLLRDGFGKIRCLLNHFTILIVPKVEADKVLGFLVEFQTDIFTPDILDRMEAYHAKLMSRGTTAKVVNQAQSEAVEYIEQLCRQTASFPANSLFQTFPDRIRLAIQLRFQHFEAVYRELGNEIVEVPSEPSELLRFGLIRLWNERQALGSRLRRN